MLIKLVSDLHLEFYRPDMVARLITHLFPVTDDDKEMVVVLAGDIFTPNISTDVFIDLIDVLTQRYRHVIYIPGNHEFYHGGINETVNTLNKIESDIHSKGIENYTRLRHYSNPLIIDDVLFVGDTLWTETTEPMDDINSKKMGDYNVIVIDDEGYKTEVLNCAYTSFLHIKHTIGIEVMMNNILNRRVIRKAVLVSHHGPTPVAAHPRFIGSELEGFFHNRKVTDELRNFYRRFDLIVHGHTHHSHDTVDPYTNVRTVANCYGYPNEECGFENDKLIEV